MDKMGQNFHKIEAVRLEGGDPPPSPKRSAWPLFSRFFFWLLPLQGWSKQLWSKQNTRNQSIWIHQVQTHVIVKSSTRTTKVPTHLSSHHKFSFTLPRNSTWHMWGWGGVEIIFSVLARLTLASPANLLYYINDARQTSSFFGSKFSQFFKNSFSEFLRRLKTLIDMKMTNSTPAHQVEQKFNWFFKNLGFPGKSFQNLDFPGKSFKNVGFPGKGFQNLGFPGKGLEREDFDKNVAKFLQLIFSCVNA